MVPLCRVFVLSGGINSEAWSSGMGVGRGATILPQEIQPDFEEEAKAYAGLWSQGKKKKNFVTRSRVFIFLRMNNASL